MSLQRGVSLLPELSTPVMVKAVYATNVVAVMIRLHQSVKYVFHTMAIDGRTTGKVPQTRESPMQCGTHRSIAHVRPPV